MIWRPHIWVPKRELLRPKRSFLPGMFPGGGASEIIVPAKTVTFIETQGPLGTSTTYNVANVDIGTPHATREVFLTLAWESASGAGRSVSSGTINGESLRATHAGVETSGEIREKGGQIVSAAVPTGTSVSVSITMSGSCNELSFGVFTAIYTDSLTPHDIIESFSGASGPVSDVIDIPEGGFVIASAYPHSSTTNWTGVTKSYDELIVNEANASGGFAHQLTAEIGRTIQSSGDRTLVAASFA